MPWDTLFSAANIYAAIAWVILILLPRWEWSMRALLVGGAGLLSLAYAFLIIGFWTGGIDIGPGNGEEGNFSSVAGVQALFAKDGGLVLGWVHYLAFDLFVGLWIAREADERGVSRFIQAPILLATFLAGPLGLTFWLIARETFAKEK
ncbi:ABA4-like family protein [Erythrobacter sp. W53]|uniref:ABA4-like family protein n=1 Tax=Erythrobacter sp. W53 TaxID=3425947 RepID=UPI003D7670F9